MTLCSSRPALRLGRTIIDETNIYAQYRIWSSRAPRTTGNGQWLEWRDSANPGILGSTTLDRHCRTPIRIEWGAWRHRFTPGDLRLLTAPFASDSCKCLFIVIGLFSPQVPPDPDPCAGCVLSRGWRFPGLWPLDRRHFELPELSGPAAD
jgi:hypothetical protein